MRRMEMAKSKSEIITEIDAHIKSRGGVDKDKDKYIWKTASSSSVARDIEQHFLGLGCDGGPGGGDTEAKVVYAYKKSSRTTP
jgi:hypothetical protein